STSFRAIGPSVDVAMGCAIPGRYNVANAMLALALLSADDVQPTVAAGPISTPVVPGRMERIAACQAVLTIGDYGHNPAAVNAAVAVAAPGDTVLVAGKGQETGEEVAGVVHPLDDRHVVRAALETAIR